jgi:hypothetical protein
MKKVFNVSCFLPAGAHLLVDWLDLNVGKKALPVSLLRISERCTDLLFCDKVSVT